MLTPFVLGSVFSGGMLVMTFPVCFSGLLTARRLRYHPPEPLRAPVAGSRMIQTPAGEAREAGITRARSIRHHELESA
jgi:hypothetical protein